jgi:thiamine pyrophosphokinase
MKQAVILANGKPPRKGIINHLLKDESVLICADGGANYAKKLSLTPDFIVGDLDSVTGETLNYFKGKSEIIKLKRQDDTDVEKCLKLLIKKRYKEAYLLGATGNRLDHTLCNLGIVIKFFDKIKIKIIAEDSILIPYSDFIELKSVPGEIISLYGFNAQTKITSTGLKYPLNDAILPFGEKESTSNASDDSKFTLDIKGGIIFVIRNYTFIKQNKLL